MIIFKTTLSTIGLWQFSRVIKRTRWELSYIFEFIFQANEKSQKHINSYPRKSSVSYSQCILGDKVVYFKIVIRIFISCALGKFLKSILKKSFRKSTFYRSWDKYKKFLAQLVYTYYFTNWKHVNIKVLDKEQHSQKWVT